MRLVATTEFMQACDRSAISRFGIPGIVLMENAGRACVDELEQARGSVRGCRAVVVCGKGNNGGDGFVIARHLVNRGARVEVLLLAGKKEVRGDAGVNLKSFAAVAAAMPKHASLIEAKTARVLNRCAGADVVVDAIFGTGFVGGLRGLAKEAVARINGSGAFVLAVDIPSGVNASNGAVENVAVKATMTVTMALLKIGHLVGDGRDHCGKLAVVDISIPPSLIEERRGTGVFQVRREDIPVLLPQRELRAHKYSVGKVFVLAGSRNFTGAPALCAQAALVSGAGAVILGVPRSIHQILARKLTEVILLPLDETDGGTVAPSAAPAIMEKAAWADTVALGPGLGRNGATDDLVRALLKQIQAPVVLDADGLTALGSPAKAVLGRGPLARGALARGALARRPGKTVLTPHAGELGRLMGMSAADIEGARVDSAREAASRFGCTVVLKGAPTVTAGDDGSVYINSSGNPGMATIGMGDVLTGLIAGLCAQGMSPEDAAFAGVYIHGEGGDRAAARLGQRSLLAHDVLDEIPRTLLSLEERNGSGSRES
jgi:hydroxyethylthiazole kinase-like uncharacterized protein yjeF